MVAKVFIDPYHNSLRKRLFNILFSLFGLILFSPSFLVIAALIKLTSDGSVFFAQKRAGKDGKVFKFIKFRTMKKNAERLKSQYNHLNEANGPVFKIRNDPRFTKFGKVLARTGLDELPQLINVIKGEMDLVGPRPLPVSEAKKLTQQQKIRELVKPGITSTWVIKGTHQLSFRQWMKLDKEYVYHASLQKDVEIIFKTLLVIFNLIYLKVFK